MLHVLGPIPPPGPPAPPTPAPPPPFPPAPPIPPAHGCEFKNNTDYSGGGPKTEWLETPGACCDLCKATQGCAAGVWVLNPPCSPPAPSNCGQCYLKSAPLHPEVHAGRISCEPNRTQTAPIESQQQTEASGQISVDVHTRDYPRVAVAFAADPNDRLRTFAALCLPGPVFHTCILASLRFRS